MKSLNLAKPHLIVVVGIPGAGKSFFAQQFSETFNAPYLRTDDLLAFSDNEEALNKLWDFLLIKLLQTKQTLLIEGIGTTIAERRELASLARKHGYQPLYVWVQTEPATAQQRATRNGNRLSEHEFAERAANFQPLQSPDHYMVISGKHTYASQARNVLKKLAEPRAESAKLTPEKRGQDRSATGTRGKITIN